jgi:hypothetical protein
MRAIRPSSLGGRGRFAVVPSSSLETARGPCAPIRPSKMSKLQSPRSAGRGRRVAGKIKRLFVKRGEFWTRLGRPFRAFWFIGSTNPGRCPISANLFWSTRQISRELSVVCEHIKFESSRNAWKKAQFLNKLALMGRCPGLGLGRAVGASREPRGRGEARRDHWAPGSRLSKTWNAPAGMLPVTNGFPIRGAGGMLWP